MPKRIQRNPDSAPQIHPFNYFTARSDAKRSQRVHQRRDLDAVCELLPALIGLGFNYGEPVLNYPPRIKPTKPVPEDRLLHVDVSFMQPGDFLLQTTRPPLSDRQQGERKKVEPGYTDLERRLETVWRRYLSICSRSRIAFTSPVLPLFEGRFENRREMHFHERQTAPYSKLNALDGNGPRAPTGNARGKTAAFLLRVDEAWPSGPGLIGAFGMDGISTQIWSYRLARDFADLLSKPGFVVVEMSGPRLPRRPTDLLWVRDWNIEIVAEYRQ